MKIRRIRAGDGRLLRDIRLRALAGAPEAFGTTLAEALAYTEQDWHDRAATRAAADSDLVMFFAEEHGRTVGMAGGYVENEMPGTVELISMWAEPHVRGRGVGMALIEAVADWARTRGVTRLQLWVTATNAPAIALYLRAGFTPTGDHQPHSSQPNLSELMMRRSLQDREIWGRA